MSKLSDKLQDITNKLVDICITPEMAIALNILAIYITHLSVTGRLS